MNSTVLKEIMAFLFGRKYYANIVATKGTTKQESVLTFLQQKKPPIGIDWKSKQLCHSGFVETVSFRSRRIYFRFVCKKLNHNNL